MATVLSLPEPNNHAAFAHPNVTLDTAELERDPTNWPRFPSQNPRLSSPHVVPRYLFRVSTPSSSGSTTTTRIQSAYSLKYPDRIPKSFLDLDSSEAAVLLNTHLRWWTEFPDDFPQTNLVSWTSDLLFAVILAIRHTKSITIRTKPLKVSSVTQPERVCILMVDTKGIEDRFVDAHKLTEHTKGQCGAADPKIRAKLEKLVDWRRGDYKMAEFLSQGCLDVDGRCVSTTLADITNAGLFKIYNDLERPWEQGPWPEDVMRRLVKAREEFLMTRPTLAKDVALAVKIGRCFGGVSGNWALYVALMVLGFAERAEPQAESVCEGLREMVDEGKGFRNFKQFFAGLTRGRRAVCSSRYQRILARQSEDHRMHVAPE